MHVHEAICMCLHMSSFQFNSCTVLLYDSQGAGSDDWAQCSKSHGKRRPQ